MIDRMLAVLAPGPSSNVSATVLPLPGAALFGPYGAAAQLVETCGAVTRGGRATCPLRSNADGPAGPSVSGGGESAFGAGMAAANSAAKPSATAAGSNRIWRTDMGTSTGQLRAVVSAAGNAQWLHKPKIGVWAAC